MDCNNSERLSLQAASLSNRIIKIHKDMKGFNVQPHMFFNLNSSG